MGTPLPLFFFFFFGLFCRFRAAPVTYGGSQARGSARAMAASLRQSHSNTGSEPQQCRMSHVLQPSNARSLTHWARPGIEPASSWMLVRFVNCWATTGTPKFEILKAIWHGTPHVITEAHFLPLGLLSSTARLSPSQASGRAHSLFSLLSIQKASAPGHNLTPGWEGEGVFYNFLRSQSIRWA